MRDSGNCQVCGGALRLIPASDYRRCAACGHEALEEVSERLFMVNDPLEDPPRWDPRDAFQRRIALTAAVARRLLVDIGCGSGRFLHLNRKEFSDHLGVEVTEECVTFARRHWGLKVESRLPKLNQAPSLITFWHSLEHFPMAEIRSLLGQVRSQSSPETRVVVCVPNGRSWQAAMFGRQWAYSDVPAHLHQFSPVSLERVMLDGGFVKESSHFSAAYVFFGYWLSFLNLVTPGHNYFYRRKKRRMPSPYGAVRTAGLDAACYAAAACFLVPAMLLTAGEHLAEGGQAVLTFCFKPRP